MSLMTSTADRLRRATALWHAYLTIAGQRFELAMFLRDPELEKQVIAGALAHGDPKLVDARAGLVARHGAGGACGRRLACHAARGAACSTGCAR